MSFKKLAAAAVAHERADRWAEFYPEARAVARDIAEDTGCDSGRAADIIAALSPQCPWPENMKLARKAAAAYAVADSIETVRVGHTGAMNRNARAAWRGYGPAGAGAEARQAGARWRMRNPNSARKVRSFAKNIRGDESAVTVDVHMLEMVGTPADASAAAYLRAERMVRREAKRHNMSPARMQAICWGYWREVVKELPTY